MNRFFLFYIFWVPTLAYSQCPEGQIFKGYYTSGGVTSTRIGTFSNSDVSLYSKPICITPRAWLFRDGMWRYEELYITSGSNVTKAGNPASDPQAHWAEYFSQKKQFDEEQRLQEELRDMLGQCAKAYFLENPPTNDKREDIRRAAAYCDPSLLPFLPASSRSSAGRPLGIKPFPASCVPHTPEEIQSVQSLGDLARMQREARACRE